MQICNPKRTGKWELERNNIQKDNGWELFKIEKRFGWEFLSTPSNVNTEKCVFLSIMIKLLKTKDKEKNL